MVIKKRPQPRDMEGSFTTQLKEGETIKIGRAKVTVIKVNDNNKKDAIRLNIVAPMDLKIVKV